MKPVWIALCAACCCASAWAAPAVEGRQVVTQFSLLTGTPSQQAADSSGTVLVSGTVIPFDSPPGSQRSDRLKVPWGLRGKLQEALRLKSVVVRYSSLAEAGLEERRELLRPLPSSSLRVFATLQGFNSRLATYRIEFRAGEKVLADSSVSVEMGKQAVVGALDGEEAPYLFLVVAPRGRESLPESPAGGKPYLLEMFPPAYTPQALSAKLTGKVLLKLVVEADGTVGEVTVLESPSPHLTLAARKGVERWRYQPPRDAQGRPVRTQLTATVVFKLE